MNLLFFSALAFSNAFYISSTESPDLSNKGNVLTEVILVNPIELELLNTCKVPYDCLHPKTPWTSKNCDKVESCEQDFLNGHKYENYIEHRANPPYIGALAVLDETLSFFKCVEKKYLCQI